MAATKPHPPPTPDLGRPIKGPSMMGDSPKRLMQLTWRLAVTDFKLRFFGSALGYLWQLLRPLMLFGVLYTVFGLALDLGADQKYFEVSMLLGIVLFTFLSEATSGAVQERDRRASRSCARSSSPAPRCRWRPC